MILEYATRRDVNGNRYYLGIDNETFIFSRKRGAWYTRDDIIEISKKDYSAGEYQADERAGVARLSWRESGR